MCRNASHIRLPNYCMPQTPLLLEFVTRAYDPSGHRIPPLRPNLLLIKAHNNRFEVFPVGCSHTRQNRVLGGPIKDPVDIDARVERRPEKVPAFDAAERRALTFSCERVVGGRKRELRSKRCHDRLAFPFVTLIHPALVDPEELKKTSRGAEDYEQCDTDQAHCRVEGNTKACPR
jgi:hypothetical protein